MGQSEDPKRLRISTTYSGGEGIRTPGSRKGSAVFKTAAFDHSATPPASHWRGRESSKALENGEEIGRLRGAEGACGAAPQFHRWWTGSATRGPFGTQVRASFGQAPGKSTRHQDTSGGGRGLASSVDMRPRIRRDYAASGCVSQARPARQCLPPVAGQAPVGRTDEGGDPAGAACTKALDALLSTVSHSPVRRVEDVASRPSYARLPLAA